VSTTYQVMLKITLTVTLTLTYTRPLMFDRLQRRNNSHSVHTSFDIAPNILYTILFIVNCNECLSAEFIGQTSVPYKRIGKHFDLINRQVIR